MNFSEKFGQHFYSYLERNFFNHREVLIKQNRCVDPSPRAHEGQIVCLSDLGEAGVQSMGPHVSERGFADLTDVTLADEDSNSIPTDGVNRAILGNVAMQVAPSGAQH